MTPLTLRFGPAVGSPTTPRSTFAIRARFTHHPQEVEYVASCPHGRPARWVSRRFDTVSTTACLCTCRETP